MTRIVKKPDIRRNEILEAAQKLFYKKGYDKTSVADIIKSVGIAKGTFYHYFKSKVDLIDEIINKDIEAGGNRIESIVEDKKLNAIQKFNKIYSTGFQYRIDNKKLVKMLLKVFYFNDDNLLFATKRNMRHLETVGPLFSKMIKQGNNEGFFNVLAPLYTAELILRIGFQLDEEFTKYLLMKSPTKNDKVILIQNCRAYSEAVERILFAPKGSLKIVNIKNIDRFFET